MSYENKEDRESVFGEGTVFTGNLTFSHAVKIKGEFTGKIISNGFLTITDTSTVKADVSASDLDLAGSLTGNAVVTGSIELDSTAKLLGDIKATSLKIDQGAMYKGHISMLKNPETIDVFSASSDQLKKIARDQ